MENLSTSNTKPKTLKLDFKDSKYATGRRKRSIAKVWVKKGSGNIYVNGIKMNDYFKRPVHQIIVTRPLEISAVTCSPPTGMTFVYTILSLIKTTTFDVFEPKSIHATPSFFSL